MPYALIDDHMHSHPKFAACSLDAIGLWALGLSWCSDHLTDGHIPTGQVERFAAGNRRKATTIAAELVDAGLWETTPTGWLYHDFHCHNPPAEQAREKRRRVSEARAEAGRRGAAARWQTDGKPHGKTMANGIANASQTDDPVPVTKELTPVDSSKSYAVAVANDSGPILLVPDPDPTATGLCTTCGCDRSRTGAYEHDGVALVCTHQDTPDRSASSTTAVTCANDGDRPTASDQADLGAPCVPPPHSDPHAPAARSTPSAQRTTEPDNPADAPTPPASRSAGTTAPRAPGAEP